MAGSEQRARGESSGGMRIDDHTFWAGKSKSGEVFPDGAHRKAHPSALGSGSLMKYEDTTERIRSSQEKANSQVKKHQGRLPEYRN